MGYIDKIKSSFSLTKRVELWEEALSLLSPFNVVEISKYRDESFYLLYPLVEKRLAGLSDAERLVALDKLFAQWSKTLNLNSEAFALLEGDFKVFSYYVLASLTPSTMPLSQLNLETTWVNVTNSEERYRQIIRPLVNRFFPEASGDRSLPFSTLRELQLRVEQFERLRRLLLLETAVLLDSKIFTLKEQFKQWATYLLTWVKHLLKMKISVEHPVYLQAADKLWNLMQSFELRESEGYPEVKQALINWYQKGAAHYKNKSYFYSDETQLSSEWISNPLEKFSSERRITSLLGKLRQDLKNIECWNRYETRSAQIGMEGKSQRATDYLSVYTASWARLTTLSESAYAFRMRYEEKFRSEKHYLVLLQKLDEALTELEKEICVIKARWMQETEEIGKDDRFFSTANACLVEFETDLVKKLERANWVHHTAYSHETTEGRISHEMNTLNQSAETPRFETYGLNTSLTLSDYVVRHLGGYWTETKKQVCTKISPDKPRVVGDLEEQQVRHSCTQRLNGLSEDAAHIAYAWQQGQWRRVADKDALALEDGTPPVGVDSDERIEEEEITRIYKPKKPLNLSFLQLHQEHKAWMASQANLRKQTQGVPYQRQFYTSDNESFRPFWEEGKAERVRLLAKIKENERKSKIYAEKLKSLREERRAYRRDIEESRRDIEVTRRKTLEFKNQLIETRKMITGDKLFELFGATQAQAFMGEDRNQVFYNRYLEVVSNTQRFFSPPDNDAEVIKQEILKLLETESQYAHVLTLTQDYFKLGSPSITDFSVFRPVLVANPPSNAQTPLV